MTNREFDELRQDTEEWIWETDPIECIEIACMDFGEDHSLSAVTDTDNDLITVVGKHCFLCIADTIEIRIPKGFDGATAARLLQKTADTLKRPDGTFVLNLEPDECGFRLQDGTVELSSWITRLSQAAPPEPSDLE